MTTTRGVRLGLIQTVSLSRIGMAVAYVLVPEAGVRLALVVAAGVSDVLDGWLARRSGLVTRLGALVDPVADRAFVFTALVTALLEGALAPLQLLLLVLRDVCTGLAFPLARALPAFRGVEFKARPLGKAVTFAQVAALLVLLAWPAALWAAVVLVGVLAVASVADYAVVVWRARATQGVT